MSVEILTDVFKPVVGVLVTIGDPSQAYTLPSPVKSRNHARLMQNLSKKS